jgi:hypothetical protein
MSKRQSLQGSAENNKVVAENMRERDLVRDVETDNGRD